ncbi:MAG: tellurite resistance TerB family protein [Oscillatoriales cyanobacterium RM2_1_1]|nr:tellurite resistance TerB family protein [Oscillatoriales cyanobacterium SM2_3_0]NJO44977.1 tellurite resistance TerB family protein [Oscillatoriales cyanobacterium RM2_1_1]
MSSSASHTINLTPAEAFAAIALVAIAADGVIANSESQILRATFARMQLFQDYSAESKNEMLTRLLDQIKQQGYEALMKVAVQKIPPDLKETAFAVATDITLSDGELADEEEQLLDALYNSLGLSEEIAAKIIDVMLIKNKG